MTATNSLIDIEFIQLPLGNRYWYICILHRTIIYYSIHWHCFSLQQLSYCSWSAFEFEWYRNGKKIRNLTSNVKYIFLNIRNLKCLLLGLHVPHEHTSKMLKSKGKYIEVINGFRMNFENNRKQYFDVDKNIKGGIVWSLAFDSNYIFTTTKILCTPCICLSIDYISHYTPYTWYFLK